MKNTDQTDTKRALSVTTLVEKQCPRCGAAIAADERFVVWCRACEWNVDPEPRRRLAFVGRLAARGPDRLARELYADVLASQHARRGGVAVGAAAWLLAAAIHLLTLAMAVGVFVWLMLSPGVWTPVRVLVAAFLAGVVGFVQPFRAARRPVGPVLGRAAAPELFALVDDVAAALRAPTVEHIVIGPDYNASYLKLGPRRPAVGIGLALWAALEPAERVALIGHELSHKVNKDLRARVVISRALATLGYWQLLLLPAKAIWRSRSGPVRPAAALWLVVDQVLAPLILVPLFALVEVFGIGLSRLAQRQGQRREYYADDLAAKAAGTRAAVGLAEKLLVDDGCWRVVVQTLRFQRESDPWQAVGEYMRAIPPAEWERLRLLGRRHLHRIDASHPPSQFRADVLRDRRDRAGLVTLTAARAAAIDAELAGARAEWVASLRASLGVAS